MTADLRESHIQKALQDKVAWIRWGRCSKRLGAVLAPAGYALFQFYAELPPKLEGTWLQSMQSHMPGVGMVKGIGITISLLGVACLAGGYLLGYFSGALRRASALLWPRYIRLRKLEPIDLDRERLIQLVFDYGDGRNPGSFVRKEALRWLIATNPEYVQAWGTVKRGWHQAAEYGGVCFFVLAPLSAAGRDAMEARTIKKNKDLRPEHVAPSFAKSRGLYIIEVFGSSFFGKGAILHLLRRRLDSKLKRKLLDPRFKIFTRPVNEFGYRQVRRYGFKNLGDSSYEMHVWQAQPVRGLCGVQGEIAVSTGAS
jgi:hypothetical protein